ncbi:MAG: DUF2179 domain-containing protein [Bacteroidales bacterium]|jgi:uncharacterized protein YebE (UPF0316 family)|nr:DUF2179 domain-containing protein [Bacteroidales bacterium]
MTLLTIFNNFGELYDWVLMPLMIFFARICDQSIGTLRVVFVSKGHKNIAPILGFFETLIWILVVRQIITDISNPLCFVAYAAGFATGNYVGLIIEEKLSIGNVIARVILPNEDPVLVEAFRQQNFGFTLIDGEGRNGKVKIIFVVLNRTNLPKFLEVLNEISPNAFYSIEDVKQVREGIFPQSKKRRFFGKQN